MKNIPTAAEVVARLQPLTRQQLEKLAGLSGVSFHTLIKIRDGDTSNPRIDTVAEFWPHVQSATAAA